MWPLPSVSVTRHPAGKLVSSLLPRLGINTIHSFTGKLSPQTDERCFSYCSQTSRGRSEGREPTCRSVCFRRVFAHEVRTAIAHDEALKGKSSQKNHGYPLPPEGQPNPGDLSSSTPRSDDIRYWEEGWYLWTSRSRWAIQERLDLMMWDLDHQDHWQRNRDQVQKEWDDYWAQHQQQVEEQIYGAPTAKGTSNSTQLDSAPYPVDGQILSAQEERRPW